MDMVYGVEPSDEATYLDLWEKYIIRWNEPAAHGSPVLQHLCYCLSQHHR